MSTGAATDGYPFALDRFQLDAMAALDEGRHVVVAAPTGSGKTVVAEHGIASARAGGRRAFYTTPIKALSNQKYADLTARFGVGEVGLLTGDNAVDGDAPVVVMTTEVLRNMIYARSPALRDLGLVVLDEVHFLQDAYRGPVWEEVIIHLPPAVRLVCLSATVSNAAELAEWIETVRGPTAAIVETRRPVRLDDYYLVGERHADHLHLLPTFVDGVPNPAAGRLDQSAARSGERRRGGAPPARPAGRRSLYTPGRAETLRLLERRDLLPAIYFIFSRNQCDEAARGVVAAGMRLARGGDREAVGAILDERLAGLDQADLAVLGYDELRAQLEAGVAPHHAGMVPAFKEAVEQCFTAGLLGAVFATETLAVGVNMPARTVVVERLTKFTGDHHEMLTPGEYTQLTGRAGRRGIDRVGQAVVLWSPFVTFDRVAELAGDRTFHLRSAFRPTYNMAANLVRTHTPGEARHLLNLSFAQYQADRQIVRLEARRDRVTRRLAEARAAAESEYGDIWEYRAARAAGRAGPVTREGDDRAAALAGLRPGDVVNISRDPYAGPAVLVASATRKGGMRLTVVTDEAEVVIVTGDDLVGPVRPLGRVRVPGVYQPQDRHYRRKVARALARLDLTVIDRPRRRRSAPGEHPVEADPDLGERMRAAAAAEGHERVLADLAARVAGHGRSLGRDFERVLDVLVGRGLVERSAGPTPVDADAPGGDETWRLTPSGHVLTRVFHESDLLIVECLVCGYLDGVGPPVLAGLLSTFVYEHRSAEPPPPPWFPDDEARRRWRAIAAASQDLGAEERALDLAVHRPPDPGFFAAAHAWASGVSLPVLVGDGDDISGGDFVRTMKQLADLARQVADVAPDPETRAAAGEVARTIRRGVVADGTGLASAAGEPAPSAVP